MVFLFFGGMPQVSASLFLLNQPGSDFFAGEMARGEMIITGVAQDRDFGLAFRFRNRTAGMERATGRRMNW